MVISNNKKRFDLFILTIDLKLDKFLEKHMQKY